jgi:hypothetical protein
MNKEKEKKMKKRPGVCGCWGLFKTGVWLFFCVQTAVCLEKLRKKLKIFK